MIPHEDPSFVVLKFGGTSVATAQRWRRIADALSADLSNGHHPVVVCSALAGVTDALEGVVLAVETGASAEDQLRQIWRTHERLADALGVDAGAVLGEDMASLRDLAASVPADEPPSPPWRALVLSAGERMSTRLGAAWLQSRGLPVQWIDARTLLQAQPELPADPVRDYLSAHCEPRPDPEVQALLCRSEAKATITQGFVARNAQGETVVLGRGGSDTAAACIAAALEAERLEIWTDVPGLFTADPRKVANARLLRRVSYDVAAVLGSLGARILHPRSLAPVFSQRIPLAIRWTDRPDVPGTLIGCGPDFDVPGIKAIASRSDLCLVRMRRDRHWQPIGFMAGVSACFHAHGLSMDLISSSPSEIRATIDLAAHPGAREALPDLICDLGRICEPSIQMGVACVSIAGQDVSQELPRVAGVLGLLGEPTLHLISHAADDTHISYVVDDTVAPQLLGAVHTAVFASAPVTDQVGQEWRELQRGSAPPPRAKASKRVAVSARAASA
ncbi:MAG: aspartate kinase [Deltaproteobacteria bacterium]|nr:aspartate kinase [Deltaproteobacteria bacterium]MCB9786634.1 aspartate kinase [Deltaproteobacteria bacterium]